jgi:hypothetical protein
MAIDLGEYDPDAKLANVVLGKFAPLPEDMEYEQFRERWLKNQQRSIGEATWEWAKAVPEGFAEYFSEDVYNALNNKSMMRSMLGLGENEGDARKAWESLFTASEVGLRDSYNTFKVLTSNVKDYYNSELSQEQQIERDWARQKYEVNYFNDAREKMMESVAPEFRDDMSVLADFLDPTNLIPSFAGTKFLNKGTRKVAKVGAGGLGYFGGKVLEAGGTATEKVFGLPAVGAEKLKLKGAYRGVQGAAFAVGAAGSPVFGAIGTGIAVTGVGEAIGKIASKTGRQMAEVSRIFAQPSSHARFLHRVSIDENVSPALRKQAARLYKMRGTKVYDTLFDGLVAGLGSGAAQVALEAAKGKGAEDVGFATGAGIAMGSPMGMLAGERGSGKSTEAFDAQGNLTERSQQSIDNYLANKAAMMNRETIKAFTKLDSKSKLALATLDELSELGNIRMEMFNDEKFREKTKQRGGASVPAVYDEPSKTIFINESQIKEGTEIASEIFLHEYGHHFISDMLNASPLQSRKILESFEDPDGEEYFFYDADEKKLGSIRVNEEAHAFNERYADLIGASSQEVATRFRDKRDAYRLAQEIGAEQFSMMMQESPNAFAKHDKSFRHMLLGAAHDALAKIGVVDPRTGNDAKSYISDALLKNKSVRKTYENFVKERADHYRQRGLDMETGRKHAPRSGQTSDERFTQLFGGQGVNLQVAAQFHIKDSVMYDELMEALEMIAEQEGEYTGLGMGAEAAQLHPKVREIFSKAGAYNAAVRSIIDMIQEHIDQRKMMKFGYRSASWKNMSQYNPFFERSVTPYAWQISPKKVRNYMGRTVYPNLKVMAYDADLIMNNVERLAHAGFIKKPDEFLEAFAQRAQEVLQPDGEGRINPQGLGENELMVAAMGLKESYENIQNPKLAEWLSHPDNKLQKSFRSYDVGQLAGLSTQNKAGFAFDYRNAKHNYMPALAGQGYRDSTIKPKRGERTPQLVEKAGDLGAGKLTPQAYKKLVDKFKPVDTLTEEDIVPASVAKMKKALAKHQLKHVGKGKEIPAGTNVGLRLDINAYLRKENSAWVPTIHEAGKGGREVGPVLAHEPVAVVDNATLNNHKNISLKIASDKINKTSFARINGQWNPTGVSNAVALAKEALANKDGSWTQVGFDPERHSYFYDRENNGLAVTSADQVVQVGRAVFAKNAVKQKPANAFGKDQYFMPAKIYGMKDTISQDVLSRMGQDKFSPQQFLAKVREVKGAKEMMEDTKLDEFIKDRKSLTKDEIYNHIAANYPKLEVISSEGGDPLYEDYKLRGGTQYEEHVTTLNDKNYPFENKNTHWDDENAAWHYRKTKRKTVEGGKSVYFLEEVQSDWHQAGRDEGYMSREEQDMIEEYNSLKAKKNNVEFSFYSKYARELVDAIKQDNEIAALIYAGNASREPQYNYYVNQLESVVYEAKKPKDFYGSRERHLITDFVSDLRKKWKGENPDKNLDSMPQFQNRIDAITLRLKNENQKKNFGSENNKRLEDLRNWYEEKGVILVPDAPFKKSWHSMALKQAISNAIKENRKYIGWTTGDQAAEMFKLDKFYNDIVVTYNDASNPSEARYDVGLWTSGSFKNGDGSDRDIFNRSAKVLEQFIGKEATKQAVEELKKNPRGEVNITDLHLKNKGMRNFYDRDLVDAAKQIAKALGVRPPIKTKIVGQNVLENRSDNQYDSWVMELPQAATGNHDEIISRMPLYMPAIETTGDGSNPRAMWEQMKFRSPRFQSFITRKGNPVFAEKDLDGNWIPSVWNHGGYLGMKTADKNLQTITGISDIGANPKQTWTPKEVSDSGKLIQPLFLSRDKDFSKQFQSDKAHTDGARAQIVKDIPVLEIATNVSNVWDYKNPKHVEALRQKIIKDRKLTSDPDKDWRNIQNRSILDKDQFHSEMEIGDWQLVEDYNRDIKELGHDGYLVTEEVDYLGDVFENLAVFNAEDVKLVEDQKTWQGTGENQVNRAASVSGRFEGRHLFAPSKDGLKAAIGVAPKRVSVVPTLDAGSAIAKQPEFQDFIQNNVAIADAFGFEVQDQRPVIGGWKDSETNEISREASHRLMIKSNSDADLSTFAAITGVLADEVQDSVMQVRYIKRNTKDNAGREYHIKIDPLLGEQITSLQFLERYGLEGGFTYDPKDEKLIFATWDQEGWSQVGDLVAAITELGGFQGIDEASATISFPEIKDYRSLLRPARIKRHYGGTNRAAIRDLAEQARTKLEEHDRAGQLFMPATDTQRVAKDKSEMVFPTTTYVNALAKGESMPQKSEDWDQSDWDKYFEDQKLADALMNQFASNPTEKSWQDVNELRTGRIGKVEFPNAPTRLLEWLNDPMKLVQFIEAARQKNPRLVDLAKQGVLDCKTNYSAKKTPEVVGQAFLWGFLSRMLDPYNQEAGWLRCTADNNLWNALYQSIDGTFTMDRGEYYTAEKMAIKNRGWEQQAGYKNLLKKKDELAEELKKASKAAKTKAQKKQVSARFKKKRDALNAKIKDFTDSRYKKLTKKAKEIHKQEAYDMNLNGQKGTWIDLVANMFDGQNAANANKAGQNAKQNINGAYSLLQKWNGRWGEVVDIFNSNKTGQQMREAMWRSGLEGGGIGDKVTSFVLATMGDGGVVIMDRWQFVNCWLNEIQNSVISRGFEVQQTLLDKKASATAKKLAVQQAKEYAKYGNNPFRYSANNVPEDRSNFYDAVGSKLTPIAEHALYRTMEVYFKQMADNLRQIDPQRYGWIDSAFAVHWLLWNIAKDEAVGHSSLDILSDILQNNTSPQDPSQRQQFIQNYQNQPSFAEKNEYLPNEGINRRTRFRIKQGKPEEEIRETRQAPVLGKPTQVSANTYFR